MNNQFLLGGHDRSDHLMHEHTSGDGEEMETCLICLQEFPLDEVVEGISGMLCKSCKAEVDEENKDEIV